MYKICPYGESQYVVKERIFGLLWYTHGGESYYRFDRHIDAVEYVNKQNRIRKHEAEPCEVIR